MLAFTFPGQGSQRPGMGLPWRDHESWELVGEASEVAGRDVAALLCAADADELRDTRTAQLTTFVSSLMVLDAVERLGIEPSYCAGHSLGEYTALTATGALAFDDGVRLVAERSAAMHDAGNAQPGTMAAVLGLDDDQVEVACRRADADVWVANFNAPGQVVIAGSPDGVDVAARHAKELGAKRVMPLQVSGAFHTPFMTAARHRLRAALAHELDPVVEAECAGGGERCVLAEAVAGAVAGLDAETLDRVEHHQARHERRQLCIAGVLEFVGVRIAEQGADVAAGNVAGLVDQFPALVIAPGQPHAGALRPLAREGESEHCRQARPLDADGRATGR